MCLKHIPRTNLFDPKPTRLNEVKEGWLSGRKHRFRKPASGKPDRGFKSLSLRREHSEQGGRVKRGGGICWEHIPRPSENFCN